MAKYILQILMVLFITNTYANDSLKIATASNFRQTLEKLIASFQQSHTTVKIDIISASTNIIYSQILQGAKFDLFFAADSEHPKKLEINNLTLPNTRHIYAIGRLVLWTKNKNYLDWQEALSDTKNERLAIANPKFAPYGVAAVEFLKKSKYWSSYKSNLIIGNNINQAFIYIEQGIVSNGLIALSQVINLKKFNNNKTNQSIFIIPLKLYSPLTQQVVVLKSSNSKKSALQFLDYSLSTSAKKIIQQDGYHV